MSDYELGPPIRPEPVEPVERWEPVDPRNPYIQRNTVTGKLRNVEPPPMPANPWGFLGP